MTTLLTAAEVLTPARNFKPGAVALNERGTVSYVGPAGGAPRGAASHRDFPDGILVPGLVDVHVHGGYGITFGMAKGREELRAQLRDYARQVVHTGVTAFLCSIAAPDAASLRALIVDYAAILDGWDAPGARPMGLHLEGPYLNPERKGAFNETWLRAPQREEVRAWLDAGGGWICQVTLAPELPGAAAAAAHLRAAGVTVSLGHSNTDYATTAAALRGDWRHVTHTFNAQRGFHHREPGVLGAVLASDGVSAELIADTIHVHPAAMTVLLRCLGPERVVLVTDAMAAAGLGDGDYELTGHRVHVVDGEARQANGTLAGSTATLDLCVRNVVEHVGLTLPEALVMASANPARAMGLPPGVGEIAVGASGDLLLLTPEVQVSRVWVTGQECKRGT